MPAWAKRATRGHRIAMTEDSRLHIRTPPRAAVRAGSTAVTATAEGAVVLGVVRSWLSSSPLSSVLRCDGRLALDFHEESTRRRGGRPRRRSPTPPAGTEITDTTNDDLAPDRGGAPGGAVDGPFAEAADWFCRLVMVPVASASLGASCGRSASGTGASTASTLLWPAVIDAYQTANVTPFTLAHAPRRGSCGVRGTLFPAGQSLGARPRPEVLSLATRAVARCDRQALRPPGSRQRSAPFSLAPPPAVHLDPRLPPRLLPGPGRASTRLSSRPTTLLVGPRRRRRRRARRASRLGLAVFDASRGGAGVSGWRSPRHSCLSPIVWRHFLALAALPARARPRPGCPGSGSCRSRPGALAGAGIEIGDVRTDLRVLLVFCVVLAVAFRGQPREERDIRPAT